MTEGSSSQEMPKTRESIYIVLELEYKIKCLLETKTLKS